MKQQIFGPVECQSCLEELQPSVGNYDWAWKILRSAHMRNRRLHKKLHSVLKRIFNPKKPYFIAETTSGVKFFGDRRDGYSRGSVMNPNIDSDLAGIVGSYVRKYGGGFVDVGANMGLVSAMVNQELKGQTRIIAFEPVPETAKRAAATFALNNMANAQLVMAAIGDEDGEISFYSAENQSEASSAKPVVEGAKWRETKVPCLRLDTILAELAFGPVGVLKVDVEGFEPQAFKGAQETIAIQKPAIVFEYHFEIAPKVGWNAEDIRSIVESKAKYDYRVLDGMRQLPFPPDEKGPAAQNVYCEPIDKLMLIS